MSPQGKEPSTLHHNTEENIYCVAVGRTGTEPVRKEPSTLQHNYTTSHCQHQRMRLYPHAHTQNAHFRSFFDTAHTNVSLFVTNEEQKKLKQ